MVNSAKIASLAILTGTAPGFVTNDYAQLGYLGVVISILGFYSWQSWKSDKKDKELKETQYKETVIRYEAKEKELIERYEAIIKAKDAMMEAKEKRHNDLINKIMERGLNNEPKS